jgi:hypothetical protein
MGVAAATTLSRSSAPLPVAGSPRTGPQYTPSATSTKPARSPEAPQTLRQTHEPDDPAANFERHHQQPRRQTSSTQKAPKPGTSTPIPDAQIPPTLSQLAGSSQDHPTRPAVGHQPSLQAPQSHTRSTQPYRAAATPSSGSRSSRRFRNGLIPAVRDDVRTLLLPRFGTASPERQLPRPQFS